MWIKVFHDISDRSKNRTFPINFFQLSSIIHHIVNIAVKHDSTWEKKKFLLQSINARNVVLTSSRKKQLPTWNCMARNQMPLRDEKRKKISTVSFLSLFLSLLFVRLFNVGLWLSPKKKKKKKTKRTYQPWKCASVLMHFQALSKQIFI